MADLLFEISVETIDFSSECFDREIKHIKTFELANATITQNDFQKLIDMTLKKKGDWYTLDYDFSINELNASVTLIFHNPEITEEEQSLVNSIIEDCEIFFVNKMMYTDDGNHRDEFPEDDGLIITRINEVEDDVYISHSEIEELLKGQGIEYKIVNLRGSQYEGGCGSGSDAFMFFIKASIESGITWDVIKLLLISKLNINLDKFDFQIIDNLKYKRLRRIIADRIQEDYKSLILIGFSKDEENDKIEISMKCRRKLIHIECNKNYEIKQVEVV